MLRFRATVTRRCVPDPVATPRTQVAQSPPTERDIGSPVLTSIPGRKLMLSRRTVLSMAAASVAAPRFASAEQGGQKVALYANVGPELIRYEVDVANAELIKKESVMLPAGVQYAWPHASRRYLYVATSSSASGYGPAGTEHHVTAFAVDPSSGALTPHGKSITLPTRPIHISTDIPSEHMLVAFKNPSAVRVYRVNTDFTPGEELAQGQIDAGIFAHQI